MKYSCFASERDATSFNVGRLLPALESRGNELCQTPLALWSLITAQQGSYKQGRVVIDRRSTGII
jgi:hypothetical protein